jgi:hypothetical protein
MLQSSAPSVVRWDFVSLRFMRWLDNADEAVADVVADADVAAAAGAPANLSARGEVGVRGALGVERWDTLRSNVGDRVLDRE